MTIYCISHAVNLPTATAGGTWTSFQFKVMYPIFILGPKTFWNKKQLFFKRVSQKRQIHSAMLL